MSYTKLFSHIVTSTIWREPKEVKILWITMLALSNKHGEVMASIPGLADMSRLMLDETEVALTVLESPDKYSRTPDHEGRRLVRIDGGWHIVNYRKHRRMASIDEQREMNAARQRRWYDKHKKPENLTENLTLSNGSITVPNVNLTVKSDNAEAEAEYRSRKVPPTRKGSLRENLPSGPIMERMAVLFRRRLTTAWDEKEIKAFKAIGEIEIEDMDNVERYYKKEQCKGKDGRHRRDLITFLNNFRGEVDRANQKGHTHWTGSNSQDDWVNKSIYG